MMLLFRFLLYQSGAGRKSLIIFLSITSADGSSEWWKRKVIIIIKLTIVKILTANGNEPSLHCVSGGGQKQVCADGQLWSAEVPSGD